MGEDPSIVFTTKKRSTTLLPIYDLHFGSQECNEPLIKTVINRIKNNRNIVTFLGGDLIECAIYNSIGTVHQQKYQVDQQVEEITEMLMPIRSKILFSICGNHEYRIEKATGLNIVKLIADNLKIPYLGWECHFLIKSASTKNICRCYATHGAGGAATSGAKVNSVERLHYRSPMANLILSGHIHFPVNFEKEIRYLDNAGNLKSHTQHFVSCGTTHESDGYASMKGMSPGSTSLASIKILFDKIIDIEVKKIRE